MKQLQELQNTIFTSKEHVYVNIYNRATGKPIQRNVDAAFLSSFNNDLSVYLNSLKSTHDKVAVRPRKPRGNSAVNAGEVIEVNLRSATAVSPQPVMPAATTTQDNSSMNAAGLLGLNGSQILDNAFASRENVRLVALAQKQELEIEQLKRKRNKYRKKVDLQDREIEKLNNKLGEGPSQPMQLLEMAIKNPGSIPALMGAFSGLNGSTKSTPNPDENLSEPQLYVIKMARDYPSFAEEFKKILHRYESGDNDFVIAIREKLNPLKKVADA